MKKKIEAIQAELKRFKLDGWLIYDFRKSNELAYELLAIPSATFITRRFFYWIPTVGGPIKIVSAIEPQILNHLPGENWVYRTWQEFEEKIKKLLQGKQTIAMEYSPKNEIPTLSKIDAGLMEIIKETGAAVISSGNVIQSFVSTLTPEQLESHLYAASVLSTIVDQAWNYIRLQLRSGQDVTEYDIQQMILKMMDACDCITEGAPICAVNENSADPHYAPTKERNKKIKKNDYILIDLWCKQKLPTAIYADITRVAVAAPKPTDEQNKIFQIVKKARDSATEFVIERFMKSQPLMGWEVDKSSRDVITAAGFGDCFIHRTGHNIGTKDHGNGTHMDNFETHDTRQVIPKTCFSIEPGIYLPGSFGVRLEYNLYIHEEGVVQITGGVQEEITCLM
jgi:Xaa-Pro aminopeptidase